MYLKNISYAYKSKRKTTWEVDNISLDRFNFIVGKNATGKSRFLGLLGDLIRMFGKNHTEFGGIDDMVFDMNTGFESYWDFVFIDFDKNIYEYKMKIGFEDVIEEKLLFNRKNVLNRVKGKTQLYSYRLNDFIEITPPKDKLTFEVRRDQLEFPFFEKIIQWVEKSEFINFAYDKNDYTVIVEQKIGELIKKLPKSSIDSVIKSMEFLEYNIEKISVDKSQNAYVKEKNISHPINSNYLSQGMHRALTLLLSIEYLLKQEISMIAIDDLGEGLDYERATKLGKLLVEKLENSNIQFIATSNDSFLMDVVPIKYWNILQRDGNTVRALNYHNSKEQFDNFKFTGLSNFDLFSSDYLMQPEP